MYNFRTGLVHGLLEIGYAVSGGHPVDASLDRMKTLGVRHVDLPFDVAGTSQLREVRVTPYLQCLFRTHWPATPLTFIPNQHLRLAGRGGLIRPVPVGLQRLNVRKLGGLMFEARKAG